MRPVRTTRSDSTVLDFSNRQHTPRYNVGDGPLFVLPKSTQGRHFVLMNTTEALIRSIGLQNVVQMTDRRARAKDNHTGRDLT